MLLVAAWEAPLRSFQPPDLALLLWGLAHCRVVPEPAWMDEWWAVSYKRLRSFTPRHLSLLLWSCVTIGQAPSRQWLAGYEAVTLPAMPYMTSQGLSLLSYTYGCLERRPPRAWLAALYGAAAGVPSDCGSQQSDGAELAAVEAGVEAPDEACGVAADVVVAGSAYEGLSRFTALGLERLLWGIAKMAPPAGSLPDDVLPGWTDAFLAAAAARLLPGHVVSSSSNSGSGVHGAGIGAGAAIAAGAGPGSSSRPAAAGAADADDFPTHGAGGGVVGLGEAGLGGEEEEADGTYGNVANTLYALALLRVRPEAAWLLPVMDRVEELLPDFGHTTLVKVSWALPRLTSGPPTHRPFTASTAPAAEAAAVHLEMPAPRDGDGAAGSPAAPANAGRDVAGEQRRLRERLASLQRLVTSRMRRTIGGRRLAGAAVAAGSGAAPDAVSDSEAADWDESLEEPGVGEPVSGVAGDVLGSRSAAGGEEDGPATAGGDGAPRPRARRRAVQRE
ncbi:hypothetical protein HXX76_013047 [Chlamydomonas incerta]|nr:hypothetical protein HXX76_013047 [Chlamydomonas incerta]|eukprot:KAG2426290.1 hypothetical protein HXX76_013047 [Chlamydomonas incerta]